MFGSPSPPSACETAVPTDFRASPSEACGGGGGGGIGSRMMPTAAERGVSGSYPEARCRDGLSVPESSSAAAPTAEAEPRCGQGVARPLALPSPPAPDFAASRRCSVFVPRTRRPAASIHSIQRREVGRLSSGPISASSMWRRFWMSAPKSGLRSPS